MMTDREDDEPRRSSLPPDGADRRRHERYPISLAVDYVSGDTFLFAYITNISEMGIFLRTEAPLPVGTELRLRFAVPDGTALDLAGVVMWINPVRADGDNPNPGMGVRFIELSPDAREAVFDLVRAIAYLPDAPDAN